MAQPLKWTPELKLYRKTIEVPLIANTTTYVLDQFQILNDKPISRFIIPSLNGQFYPTELYGGTGTYLTSIASPSNKPIANIEAIDGAYLNMLNRENQLVASKTPLKLYRQDPTYFSEKGLFVDKPCIDFTQTEIVYPDATIPTAEDGNSILIIVEYYDVLA